MGNRDFIQNYLTEVTKVAEAISVEDVDRAIELLFEAWKNGNQVFTCGNGGSASTATHFACDLVKNTSTGDKKGFRAECLNDNIPLMLALINDDGFDNLFYGQLRTKFQKGDVLICISVHGGAGEDKVGPWSQNLLKAMKFAQEIGGKTIGLSGFDGGPMKEIADACIVVPINSTLHVESFHLALEHLICGCLKEKIGKYGEAVFLDRDGVINELVYYPEHGIMDSPFTMQQFKLRPGVAQAIKLLNQKGLKVIVVSNQPGLAKNHFTQETLSAIDVKMKAELGAQGAFLDSIYYCLHHPDGEQGEYGMNCTCRKPQPGLLLQAAEEFDLDLNQCYMVGDGLIDVKAGKSAGCRTLLIGKVKCELCHLMDDDGVRPDAIVHDLLGAVETILNWEDRHGDLH